MRALWFLTWRLLVNSIRRTLRHPVRAVIFMLLLVCMGFPIAMSLAVGHSVNESLAAPFMPTDELIALIMLVHLSMLWTALSPWYSTMLIVGPADEHFLFPSPLRRLGVFLFLLVTRGVATSIFILFALVMVVLGVGNELIVSIAAGQQRMQSGAVWAYPVMYLLAFLGLLAIGMLILLRDEQSEGFRARLRLIFWAVLGVLGIQVGWHSYRAYAAREDMMQAVVWRVLYDPAVAIPLLPLRGLAEAAVAFYRGWSPYVTAGFVTWGSVAAGAFLLLARQEAWLYDLGTRVASLTIAYRARRQNPLMQAQDFVIQRAQGRRQARRWHLFKRWTPQGVWALLWCNGILLTRMGSYLLFSVLVMFLGITTMALVNILSHKDLPPDPAMLITLQYSGAFFVLTFSQAWISNALKRAELTKSLPFPARQTVLMEVLPTALLLFLFLTAYWVICCALLPNHARLLTYHYAVGISLVLPLNLCVMMVSLINPDPGDHVQRVLLNLLLFPAILVTALPTVLVVVFAFAVDMPLWLNALLVAGVNVGMTWALVSAAGESYALMNPAE